MKNSTAGYILLSGYKISYVVIYNFAHIVQQYFSLCCVPRKVNDNKTIINVGVLVLHKDVHYYFLCHVKAVI